jgi:ABC-type nitrate/sulfonate/bicarbonate transport system substrate-binding protein
MVPAMHAPALWFLYIAPPPAGPDVIAAIVRALERGRDFFTQHVIQIWADVGDTDTGRALADLLSAVDDARFHDSLSGNVAASMDIIEFVTTLLRSKGPTT